MTKRIQVTQSSRAAPSVPMSADSGHDYVGEPVAELVGEHGNL